MVETARAAEQAGAASIWMAQHMGWREAVAACGAFAVTTERAMLVPTAISPYLWHPVATAMSFATLAELAPGRAAVAVSIGNLLNLRESGWQPEKPVRAIREFVEDLRALWRGEAVSREAVSYRLDGARLHFEPPGQIPVYIASTGPQVLGLAGRIADGVLLSGGISLAYTRQCLEHTEEGRKSAAHAAEDFSRASFIFFAVSENGKDAIDEVRRKLAYVFRNKLQAGNIASAGLPIDHEAIIAAVERRDLDAAAALVSDDAVEAFGVAGTPAQCRDSYAAYVAAGLDEPILQVSGTPENRALALDLVREFSGR